MKVVKEIAPSKDIRIKNNTQEWFDREIAELIHAGENLFLKFKKSKLHIDEENYKKVKYQVENFIRKKKKEFYETNLRQKINKPKELWKILKSMGLPSKAVTASNICLKDKNEIVFNATKNCSIFKNYFSSLAQNLASKLPLSPDIFTESKIASYYNNNAVSKDLNFQLLEMSPGKISSILKSLNPSKVAGTDNLSGKFLKDSTHVLAQPISQFCNLSIKLNSFPRSCKIAKVKPLFKKGSKTDPQNYCSISLLPLLPKIIERIVHDETEEFLSKNKLLYRFHSTFRRNYSTNTCLGHLTDKITTGFEKGLFTGMILIDLQKVFDTIDHQILLKKMKYLGFSKNAITWLKSYLCERKFKISINTSYSSSSNLLCGIPRGSILGPLLFLLYINDLPQAAVSDSLLYADDTCIVFQHKSEIEIEKQLIRDFSSLCHWFVDNKLSIHFGQDKTKSILFGTKHKL